MLKKTYFTISTNKIPKNFNKFKIVQLSDLHKVRFGKHQERLIQKIKEEKPDIILLTGDFAEPNRKYTNTLDLINGIKDLCPVYFVSGNHDFRLHGNYEKFKNNLERKGVIVLNNNSRSYRKKDTHIKLFGINDPAFTTGEELSKENYEVAEKEISHLKRDDSYSILLSHHPEFMDLYSKYNFDLVFSGHSHGGQVSLPLIGALYVPNQGLFPEYQKGIYKKDTTTMIVSSGLGYSHLPFRLMNIPEIVVVNLEYIKKKSD